MSTVPFTLQELILRTSQMLHRAADSLSERALAEGRTTARASGFRFWVQLGMGLLFLVLATAMTFMSPDRVERNQLLGLCLAVSFAALYFAYRQWKLWREITGNPLRLVTRASILAVAIVATGCCFTLVAKAVADTAREKRLDAIVRHAKELGVRNAQVRQELSALPRTSDSFDTAYSRLPAQRQLISRFDAQIQDGDTLLDNLRREYFRVGEVMEIVALLDTMQQESRSASAGMWREVGCLDSLHQSNDLYARSHFREICVNPNLAEVDDAMTRRHWIMQMANEKSSDLVKPSTRTLPLATIAETLDAI